MDNHKTDAELTLRPHDPTPRTRPTKPKAPKALADLTPTVRLERAFQSDFEQRYGFPMGNVLYKAPRDRKILKTLIADVGEVEARALVHDFFFRFDKDRHVRFLTRAGNVPDFQKCLDRLVVLRNGAHHDDPPDRILDNDREIDRARGRHE